MVRQTRSADSETITRARTASLISEALKNYPLADEPLRDTRTGQLKSKGYGGFYDDESFWCDLRTLPIGTEVHFYEAIVSEWVARVPGLYWSKGAARRREPRPEEIENRVGQWITLRPVGKSQFVSGGIGTLRFSSSEDGFRLVTLTTSANASSGVPALVSPEVWSARRLAEGSIIQGEAIWRDMPQQWASQFPITAGVRKGCLVLSDPESIRVVEGRAPVEIHPFSIMEYSQGGTLMHDFVFATAQTGDASMRMGIERFFDKYKDAGERFGTYLTGGDMADPMWDATFISPEQMRRARAATLNIIESRVDEAMQGKNVTDSMLSWFSQKTAEDLRRISTDAGLAHQLWSEGGRVGDEAIRLVDAAKRANKIPALLYAMESDR